MKVVHLISIGIVDDDGEFYVGAMAPDGTIVKICEEPHKSADMAFAAFRVEMAELIDSKFVNFEQLDESLDRALDNLDVTVEVHRG